MLRVNISLSKDFDRKSCNVSKNYKRDRHYENMTEILKLSGKVTKFKKFAKLTFFSKFFPNIVKFTAMLLRILGSGMNVILVHWLSI